MAVRVTHVRMSPGGSRHEHIDAVRWVDDASGQIQQRTVAVVVDWIDHSNGHVYVTDGQHRIAVGTVHPAHGRPYIRTYKDGVWTGNLLGLPRF